MVSYFEVHRRIADGNVPMKHAFEIMNEIFIEFIFSSGILAGELKSHLKIG